MGGLSLWHIAIVVVVLLIFFAHRHIPAALEALGRAIGRLRRSRKRLNDERSKIIEGVFQRRD